MTTCTCLSMECREAHSKPFTLPPDKKCPVCGYSNTLRAIATVHYLVRDVNGNLKGYNGNYRPACGVALKDINNATGDIRAANCPECLKAHPPEPVLATEESPTLPPPDEN